MSDPYNSYQTHIPPATVKVTTAPALARKPDPISRLDVSDSWRRKFRLVDQAGGPDLPNFRDLTVGDRFTLNFNVLALIFGPFYYLVKGLWRQAVLYVIFAVVLILIMEALGLGRFSRAVGYGFGAIYSMRANVSYYKKIVLGEAPWL